MQRVQCLSDDKRTAGVDPAMAPCPSPGSDAELEVRLFGSLEVWLCGDRLMPFATRKAESVFAYLVVHAPRAVPRDQIAGLFWPEAPDLRARKNLRTELWRIRARIEPRGVAPGRFLEATPRIVRVQDGVHSDYGRFSELLGAAERLGRHASRDTEFDDDLVDGRESDVSREADLLDEAILLHSDGFLAGCWEDWAIELRRHTMERLTWALDRLSRIRLSQEQTSEAIAAAERLVAVDPLREDGWRTLMACAASQGNGARALAYYRQCHATLRDEVGLSPTDETRSLARSLSSGGERGAPARETETQQRLDAALDALGEEVGRIAQAIEDLRQELKHLN